ncbi:flagellar FlbD family protein [bacterium]|jgi:flagellar protein FlbD|nr:flagellar FlbD family protein [bacterium]
MIPVSRLNGKEFIVNCELIKYIESTPDTMLTLTTGEKLLVKESPELVINRTIEYRKKLYQEPPKLQSSQ